MSVMACPEVGRRYSKSLGFVVSCDFKNIYKFMREYLTSFSGRGYEDEAEKN